MCGRQVPVVLCAGVLRYLEAVVSYMQPLPFATPWQVLKTKLSSAQRKHPRYLSLTRAVHSPGVFVPGESQFLQNLTPPSSVVQHVTLPVLELPYSQVSPAVLPTQEALWGFPLGASARHIIAVWSSLNRSHAPSINPEATPCSNLGSILTV